MLIAGSWCETQASCRRTDSPRGTQTVSRYQRCAQGNSLRPKKPERLWLLPLPSPKKDERDELCLL